MSCPLAISNRGPGLQQLSWLACRPSLLSLKLSAACLWSTWFAAAYENCAPDRTWFDCACKPQLAGTSLRGAKECFVHSSIVFTTCSGASIQATALPCIADSLLINPIRPQSGIPHILEARAMPPCFLLLLPALPYRLGVVARGVLKILYRLAHFSFSRRSKR